MIRVVLLQFLLVLACLSAGLFANADEKEEAGSWENRTVAIVLGDTELRDGRLIRDFDRMISRANTEKASAVVFEINTNEAAVWDSQQRILSSIQRLEVPSLAFVKQSGIGSGTLIALASDTVYLAPSAIVGAAGIGDAADEEDKVKQARLARENSVMKAMARSLAKANGHRVDVAEAMVDPEIELKLGDRTLSRKGEVLTLTADEAAQADGGKPLFAKGIVTALPELLKAENLKGKPLEIRVREFGESSSRDRLVEAKETDGKNRSESKKSDGAGKNREGLFSRREEGSYEGKVVVLKVGEDTLATGKASFDFIDRTLKKAELDGAEAVIFDMDTPGGYAWQTVSLVLNGLQNVTFPTYTFVNTRAESAGAIIAMGTDHIYMKPAASIGSALVVTGTGQDLTSAMNDKITQMMIGTIRNVAELKGHNPDIGEAFVTRDKEVKIDGIVIHESGNVLNLNTIRATEEIGGRPVLAKGIASSLEQLAEKEGLKGELLKSEPLGMEAFAHWVQKLSFLLIIVGLAGAYVELNSPGFGLPGLLSIGVLSLFFFGNYLAGNLAGYELAVLLVVGLILIGIEVFLFPGAILPGLVGTVLVLVSLGLAMVDRVDFEWKLDDMPDAKSWGSIFSSAFWSLLLGMGGALAAALLAMRYLPDTKMGSRLVLQESVARGASIAASRETTESADYLGLVGKATTDLVPSGKGLFDDRVLDIVSDGEFIGKEDSIRVIRHEGSRIVVEKA